MLSNVSARNGSQALPTEICKSLEKWRADERTRTAYPCSSYE